MQDIWNLGRCRSRWRPYITTDFLNYRPQQAVGHRRSLGVNMFFALKKTTLLAPWESAGPDLSAGAGDRASSKEPKMDSNIIKEPGILLDSLTFTGLPQRNQKCCQSPSSWHAGSRLKGPLQTPRAYHHLWESVRGPSACIVLSAVVKVLTAWHL